MLLLKNFLVGEKEENIGEKQEDFNMSRDNILLRKLPTPKPIQLPNGRVFYAKYARVGRANLPPNVRIRRRYVKKISLRRQKNDVEVK